MCNQAASNNGCIIDRGQVHCNIYGYIDIDKQGSYVLAFMTQVKVFNTLGDYKSLHHHFTQCIWPDY